MSEELIEAIFEAMVPYLASVCEPVLVKQAIRNALPAGTVTFTKKPQVDRVVRLLTHEINSLTGQLVLAIQATGNENLSGSRRKRAEAGVAAIPEQLELCKEAKEVLVKASTRMDRT